MLRCAGQMLTALTAYGIHATTADATTVVVYSAGDCSLSLSRSLFSSFFRVVELCGSTC
eukprot:COSAG03_NODE_5128_length_1334_cov_1.848583_1_plen_58_part_10